MLRLVNLTPFQADRAVLINKKAQQVWVVIIKGTFNITESGVELSNEQEAVCPAPRFLGGSTSSSLLRDSEFVVEHPGTDITLNATAHAPGGRPVERLTVGVRIANLEKSLAVVGDRTPGFLLPGAPEPFTRMPIGYERSYGGRIGRDENNLDSRNPIGRGPYGGGSTEPRLLPNIFSSTQRLDAPTPAGFGAIPSNWSPRKEFAGTYDDKWQQYEMPLWPRDFDPRFYLSAPTDLVADPPLRGGEKVDLINLTPAGRQTFYLPRYRLTADTHLGGARFKQTADLDRVIIEPDEQKLVMVWRASLVCETRCREIDRTVLDFKPHISK